MIGLRIVKLLSLPTMSASALHDLRAVSTRRPTSYKAGSRPECPLFWSEADVAEADVAVAGPELIRTRKTTESKRSSEGSIHFEIFNKITLSNEVKTFFPVQAV